MNQYTLILFERLYIFSSLIKGAIAPILKNNEKRKVSNVKKILKY